jgi:hypothetical protein
LRCRLGEAGSKGLRLRRSAIEIPEVVECFHVCN